MNKLWNKSSQQEKRIQKTHRVGDFNISISIMDS